MSKEIKKFSSIEELNGFISDGKIIYSLANSGNIWFVECETNSINTRTTVSVPDEFEELIEKAIRLGYIEVSEFAGSKQFRVNYCKNCCSLALGHSDVIKKQMIEFCYKYETGMTTRRELEEYVELKK